MLPSTLKYLYSVEPVRMHFPCTNDTVCNAACSIAHSAIRTRLFRGKMHSDWFNGIEILQGRWQHGEKVGYCYPSGLEKTLCSGDIYVPLVTKGLKSLHFAHTVCLYVCYGTLDNGLLFVMALWIRGCCLLWHSG